MSLDIRKIVTIVEETLIEGGQKLAMPTRRAAAIAVVHNPFAGRYVEDLTELADMGERLGEILATRAIAALGVPGTSVESYGKATGIGEDGELEHGAALMHPKLGAPFRRLLGGGAAIIPSSKKRGGAGMAFDIPLGHKDAVYVRSHFDGMSVTVGDAPRPNEVAVAVAVTDSGRPLARIGGLQKSEIKGTDGLR